jgi:outer membrane protein assembly factor BamB
MGGLYDFICAIDLQTQQEIWQKRVSSLSIEIFFNNLIAADGIIYYSSAGASTLYALEPQTGRELWKFTVPKPDLLSLMELQPDSYVLFFLLWNLGKKIFTETSFVPFSPPIIADGAIYINYANGCLYALH